MSSKTIDERINEIITGVWASGVYDQADGESDCVTDATPMSDEEATAQINALINEARIAALNDFYLNSTERIVAWDSEESLRQSWLSKCVEKEIDRIKGLNNLQDIKEEEDE